MEIKLGATIKKLRVSKGVTQEELGEYIGVSYQAVSEWETDITMPDISLLPKLATFFGVRIDDLFSINTDDELERIDYMLEHENLTDDNFIYAKRILDSILHTNKNDVALLIRYARLYLSRMSKDALATSQILEKAMPLAPLNSEIFVLYRQCHGYDMSGNDRFIRVCEPYAKKYPSNIKLQEMLIQAMIEMHYFEKASEYITNMQCNDEYSLCLPKVFKGDIEYAKGNSEKAYFIWDSIDEENHKGQYEAGERFNRANEYEKAIKCYKNSFACSKTPRDLSAMYSLAFLYKKLGQYQNAINAWQTIIDVLASDHSITNGKIVEWALREIQQLKSLK